MPQSLETDALVASTWPYGLSSEDAALWLATTPTRREKALNRLAAILDYEAGRLESTAAAVKAGDSAPTFFRVMKAWRSSRSLVSLIPYSTTRRGEREGERLAKGMREEARRLVEEAHALAEKTGRGRTKEAIVLDLAKAFPGKAVPITLRKLVAAEMAAQSRRTALFGRRILVDSCAVDLSPNTRSSMRAMVDVVLDMETGLVLALHRPHEHAGISERWEALLERLERWVAEAPDDWREAEGVPTVLVVLPDVDAIPILRHLRSLPPGRLSVFDQGERRTGRRAHAALAGKIGRLALRPRLPAIPGFHVLSDDGGEPPTAAEFDALAAHDVQQHNALLLASVGRAASSPDTVLRTLQETMVPATGSRPAGSTA